MKNNKVLPPTYFVITVIFLVISHLIFPVSKILYYPVNLIGFVFVFFGIVLNLWTDMLFKKAKTTVKPFQKPSILITSGPFLISRHPMYLGMTAILFGIAILLGSLITFLFPVIFAGLMQKWFISKEEENLETIFGQKYKEYKNSIRCWI